MQNHTIYNEADYFEKITQCIAKAGRGTRISLISMMFEPSELPVRLLVEGLIAAAKRGARIELLIDAHAFMLTSSNLPLGPLFWHQDMLKGRSLRHFHQKTRLLEA